MTPMFRLFLLVLLVVFVWLVAVPWLDETYQRLQHFSASTHLV